MVTLTVNGQTRMFDGDPDMPLLWYLRDDLRLTGTKFGCGAGLVRRLHRARGRHRPSARARRRCATLAEQARSSPSKA